MTNLSTARRWMGTGIGLAFFLGLVCLFAARSRKAEPWFAGSGDLTGRDHSGQAAVSRGRETARASAGTGDRREPDRTGASPESPAAAPEPPGEVRLRRWWSVRVAELTDLVAELMLPTDLHDDEAVQAALQRYREESL